MRKTFKLLIIVYMCCLWSCTNHHVSLPDIRIAVTDPNPTLSGCCHETIVANATGVVTATGGFIWLGLTRNGDLVKSGDPSYVIGPYNQPLSLEVNRYDRIAAGTYQLQGFVSNSLADVGLIANATSIDMGDSVGVSAFADSVCLSCDSIQITYRTFIACEMIPDPIYSYFYSGDNRSFQVESPYFRSSMVSKVAYVYNMTVPWISSNESLFGITRKWPPSAAVQNSGDTICPYKYDIGYTGTDSCHGQAVAGQNGNVQATTVSFEDYGNRVHIRMDLTGFNPCASLACAIDGVLDCWLEYRVVDGIRVPYYTIKMDHNRFPWHEVYVRRLGGTNDLPAYTWDASDFSIINLCDALSLNTTDSSDWRIVQ